jgi:hypothetical protein
VIYAIGVVAWAIAFDVCGNWGILGEEISDKFFDRN